MNHRSPNIFDESLSIKKVFERYFFYWKWFAMSILFCFVLVFVKVLYEVPQYKIGASILIKESGNSSSFSDIVTIEDMGLIGLGENSLENEIQILKSKQLVSKVIDELRINIRYSIIESPINIELYPDSPIILNFVPDSLDIRDLSSTVKVSIVSNESFKLENNLGETTENLMFGEPFEVDFGSKKLSNRHFIILEKNDFVFKQKDLIGRSIEIKIMGRDACVESYLNNLAVEPINERFSDVLNLTLKDSNKKRGISFLRNLIQQYNADGILEQSSKAQSTTDFLDLRIGLISAELQAIENSAEQFKSQKGIVSENSGGDIFLENSAINERELISANTEKELVDYLRTELKLKSSYELLPANVGLRDPSILSMIDEFNDLVLQRNRILKSSSDLNPIIVNLDSQLDNLKRNLLASLDNLYRTLEIRTEALGVRKGQINSKIYSAPKNERQFKDIVREREMKNELYLFYFKKEKNQ